MAEQSIEIDGNALTLITEGPDRRAALLDLIAGAGETLCLYYYTFAADEAGRAVRDALIEARGRGVAVTLLVDGFGSSDTPEAFLEDLRDVGGRVGRFIARPSARYLIRNHQKMAIADTARAIVGGFNVEDGYFATGDNKDGWCDLALTIDGPIVVDLQHWYDGIAAWVLSDDRRFRTLRRLVREWSPGEGRLQWLMGGPTERLSCWAQRVKRDLEGGRRLDMVAAYFSPGRGMLRRLRRVARRGDARLIMPLRSDNTTTIGAARHLYRRMLRSGLKLFEYECCKLHMKLIVIDDIVYIGSANFDKRSLFLNVEIMLRIKHAGFAEAVRAIVVRREKESRPIDRAAYKAMAGPVARLRWWISYQLVGVLDYSVTRRLNFRSEPTT